MEIGHLHKALGGYPLFQGMAIDEISSLLDGHRFRNVRHHQHLYQAGEPADSFAIVLVGAFKLVRSTPKGEDTIVYFATPGEVIGGLLMQKSGGAYPISAVALGPSTALTIPKSTFVNAWQKNIQIQSKLMSTLYSRMCVLQDDKVGSKQSLQQRVAMLLLSLLDKRPDCGPNRIPIPLTRQEIADTVGASVESVIRCMSELSQQGFIQTEEKQIEILRTDKIAEILKA